MSEKPQETRRVIPHPTKPGLWTIAITDERGTAIYGEHTYELAVAILLTR
jgi:hypothetical protein